MRILLVSDIHANRAALDAIREPHDLCLCLGDLVEYGPEPGPCVEWAREHCAYVVRGNHDHGMVQQVQFAAYGGFKYLTMATRRYTHERLSADQRGYLADLPTSVMLSLDRKRYLLVHASPRDPMDEYVPQTEEAWAARLVGLRVDFLCVGHTHQQFTLQVDDTTVVNPGAVGVQRDGTTSVRYAVIDNGQVELKQVEYDVSPTLAAIDAGPFEPRAKRMLKDVFSTGRFQRPEDSAASNGLVSSNATAAHHPFTDSGSRYHLSLTAQPR